MKPDEDWPRPDAVHDPGGLDHAITTLWAFIAVDDENREGIVATILPARVMPMVTGEPANIDGMRKAAKDVVAATGKQVKLVRFEGRVEEEVIKP